MKIPISKRLRLCAQLVPPGARVADIGTDHGYLGLYLLQNGLAAHVLAADLRPQPLQTAKLHAAKFGFAGQMEFRLSDGLAEIAPDEADTIVCAGMGGDLIVEILSACPWAAQKELHAYLAAAVCRAGAAPAGSGSTASPSRASSLCRTENFYTQCSGRIRARALPSRRARSTSRRGCARAARPLLGAYMQRIETALRRSVEGLMGAEHQRPERLAYYRSALEEVEEMRKNHENGTGNL